jgi:DNA replication protein DnaC
MSSRYTELTSQLRSLKLSTMAESFSDIALKAVRNGLSHEAFLHELVRLECEAREQRRRARLLQESGLPREKSFGTLQLGAFPPLVRQQIERLHSGAFVQQAINVVVVGKPGAGKSHLLASLGHAMAVESYRAKDATITTHQATTSSPTNGQQTAQSPAKTGRANRQV